MKKLQVNTDSDYTKETRRSETEIVRTISGAAISWFSQR